VLFAEGQEFDAFGFPASALGVGVVDVA
jgi:hypothetical protein